MELKFLLKLLGFPDYRAPLSKVTPNSKTTIAERERLCRQLRDRELVDCAYEVTKLKITPSGKALLKLDPTELPVTDKELKVLWASAKATITPSKTGVAAGERPEIIQGLATRGLIELETKIKEVWLSQQGQQYLRHDYTAKGTQPVLSLDMLTSYLKFLRTAPFVSSQPMAAVPATPPSDQEILQTIRDLDQQLGTGNYLPIFHLRHKLQPPLSREELDDALYRLESDNKINLSVIVEARHYSPEELNAGIPLRTGSRLFFIEVIG